VLQYLYLQRSIRTSRQGFLIVSGIPLTLHEFILTACDTLWKVSKCNSSKRTESEIPCTESGILLNVSGFSLTRIHMINARALFFQLKATHCGSNILTGGAMRCHVFSVFALFQRPTVRPNLPVIYGITYTYTSIFLWFAHGGA
jgi:hypothetical protein